MTGTPAASKFGTWSASGHDIRIEYASAALDEIRMAAVEGYHLVPHGGVETGGILYGTHQKSVVRIKAWRPISCQYSKGPSFLLSEAEEAALAATLKSWRDDPDLARLEPVGWYRSHTRSEILLSDADLAFFQRFFPQAWQIGLIVRPASFAPTRAGFFFREGDGTIRSQSCYREFTLTPTAAPRRPRPEAHEENRDGAALAPAEVPTLPQVVLAVSQAQIPPVADPVEPLENVPAEPVVVPEPAALPPSSGFGVRAKWSAAGLALLAIAAVVWLLLPAERGLKLSATDAQGLLRISWDGASRAVGSAKQGSIDIDDHGVRTQVSLSPSDLRSGSVFYARQTGDVGVRLTVDVPGGPPLTEMTRFLKAGPAIPAVPAPTEAVKKPARPPKKETKQEAKEARVKMPPPVAAPPSEPPLTARVILPATPARRVIPFQAPKQAAQQSATNVPSIAPPTIENLPAAPPPGLTSVLGTPTAPPIAPAAPPHTVAATQAGSGRVIWTGRLAKNGRLVIEKNHASSGAVSGALPGVAARVFAYPGDLTASGITLFTADPTYSSPRTEKAGAENGWNSTTYTWDPKRASGIKVVEQPNPQNGYKLVLQSDIPKLSVLVIDWRATQ